MYTSTITNRRCLTILVGGLMFALLQDRSPFAAQNQEGMAHTQETRGRTEEGPQLTTEQRVRNLEIRLRDLAVELRESDKRLEARVDRLVGALRRGSGIRGDSDSDDKSDSAVDGIQVDLANLR